MLTYTPPSGPNVSVTVNYTAYNVETAFNCSGINQDTAMGMPLVSSIVMPDNSQDVFTYEATLGISGYVTGRIQSIQTPTGGTITYSYSGGSGDASHNAIYCADGSVPTLTRTLKPGGPWTYARSRFPAIIGRKK